jgi:hypothetical protein
MMISNGGEDPSHSGGPLTDPAAFQICRFSE